MSIQSESDKQRFSRLRQSLVHLAEELRQLLQPFFCDKPVIKGSVYELKRKCGKRGCRCAQGHLHSCMVLSSSEKGKTRLRVIPRGRLVDVETRVERYQRLRRARARLIEVHKRMVRVVDEMEGMRREQME